jgi:hypothetical protein
MTTDETPVGRYRDWPLIITPSSINRRGTSPWVPVSTARTLNPEGP